MVRITPWKVFLRTSLVCLILGFVIFGLSLRKIDSLPVNEDALHFDSQRAFHYTAELSKKFPNRVSWSDSRRNAAKWLKDEFKKIGYSPKGMPFTEVIAGKQYTDLENIYAEKKGKTHPDEIVVAMAHYDVTDTTVEGAMDDASGVGVVLELARVFAHEDSDRTLVFLVTDSEEFGSFWGSRAFTHSYPKANQIVAAANFDFVAPEVQTKILTLCDGLKKGYTPLWLRELALDSLRSVGSVDVLDLMNVLEFIERAIQIPPADHASFLAAGIPAFNWVGQTNNFAYEMAHYHHTKYDVMEAMRPESFEPFGKAAERLIRSINDLPKIPEDFRDSSYWKISTHQYIDSWAVTLLHILAFIPFLSYCISRYRTTLRGQKFEKILEILLLETKNIGMLLGSFLLGYVIMLLLPALRVITQYETFPATQKSILLFHPDFLAISIVLASVFAIYWILSKTFPETPNLRNPPGFLEIRHALHAVMLAFIIFLAFLKNSYLAVLLLLPPAYFWTFIRSKKTAEDRILNGLLLLGGSITFVTTIILMTSIFHIGVFYWYLFLAAAYGLISAYSVVLFFMAFAVMIRLFRNHVI